MKARWRTNRSDCTWHEADLCALTQIDHDEMKHPVHLGEHAANGSHPANSIYSVQLESFCAYDLLGKLL